MYLLHGENTYLSWDELQKLKKEAINRTPGVKFIVLDSDDTDISKLPISGYSLFPGNECFIFKRFFNLPLEIREKIWREILRLKLDDIIFWEDSKADKRSKIYKEMQKSLVVREYELLKESEMCRWISKELRIRNMPASISLVAEIYFRYGSNQFIVEKELEKIRFFEKILKEKLTEEEISELLSEGMVADNWKFNDLFFAKRKKEAINYIMHLDADIEQQKQIIGGLAGTLRNTYLAKIYSGPQLEQVRETLKINPYPLRKAGKAAMYFTKERLEKLYAQLMNFDYALNTSYIEFKLGMVLLIMSL